MRASLNNLLVVSLEQAVAAPFASCKLAQSGARVIKIERADGDFAREYDHVVHGESAYFVWLNQGKESLVLDIKGREDAALLHRILASADVFIQNLVPGGASRAGFGSESLRRMHPRLITCDISGYGESGPYAKMKAYDNLLQGETGLLAVTGQPDAPAKVGVSLVDISAGIHAYASILEALLARESTGQGAGIKISLFDCMADWMTVPYLHQVYGNRAPPRSGTHHASVAPYGCYAAGDGRQVIIGIQNEREWKRFCQEVLEQPEIAELEIFASNSQRVAHRDQLNATINEVFKRLSMEDLIGRLQGAGIAFGRMNSVAEFAQHPQLRLTTIETPSGPVDLPALAVQLTKVNQAAELRVPALGEHSEAIRREFSE
ncbi:MAG: CaiB/BaiF CoA-transferase family protein [Gammaproteobacteria bacterium]|nr:MAG: CaiB/BaiF CoA-transferase family protein [Gammaproteobacteria bacterium]